MGWQLYLVSLVCAIGIRRSRGGGLTDPGRADRGRV